ncbi:10346_t:CDS:2 [Ambispora gerdemannii]|uniref:10346_t:CDS:1 n=1 Tax=Ambispora gerdemannii TaxID=144530 RepID=A0A9N8WL13_9GLOM|nr:10346_t:CDS:2 [Ambispora gerdemannii]
MTGYRPPALPTMPTIQEQISRLTEEERRELFLQYLPADTAASKRDLELIPWHQAREVQDEPKNLLGESRRNEVSSTSATAMTSSGGAASTTIDLSKAIDLRKKY